MTFHDVSSSLALHNINPCIASHASLQSLNLHSLHHYVLFVCVKVVCTYLLTSSTPLSICLRCTNLHLTHGTVPHTKSCIWRTSMRDTQDSFLSFLNCVPDNCVSNALYRLLLAHFDPLSPLSSLFLLPFPFYFIHLIILDHSVILLDFQFLVHLFYPILSCS